MKSEGSLFSNLVRLNLFEISSPVVMDDFKSLVVQPASWQYGHLIQEVILNLAETGTMDFLKLSIGMDGLG